MAEKIYDVVIVGGGFAGAAIAKIIAKTRQEADPDPRGWARDWDERRQVRVARDGLPVVTGQLAEYAVPERPNAPQAKSRASGQPRPAHAPWTPAVPGAEGAAAVPERLHARAGRHIAALAGHLPADAAQRLPANTQYGQGVDWPMDYEELRPYYEEAEHEIIGVAGSVDEQHYPGIDEEVLRPGPPGLRLPDGADPAELPGQGAGPAS